MSEEKETRTLKRSNLPTVFEAKAQQQMVMCNDTDACLVTEFYITNTQQTADDASAANFYTFLITCWYVCVQYVHTHTQHKLYLFPVGFALMS